MQFLRSLAKHRLREWNKCHEPAGADSGGQFCSTSDTSTTTQRDLSDTGREVLAEITRAGQGAQAGRMELLAPRPYQDPDYAVVGNVNVPPKWQGQGHASALYDEAVATAKRLGYRGIQAGDLNSSSERYWKRWLETGKAKLARSNARQSAMVREFNPCHMPAGTDEGGQFADKGSEGCAGPAHGPLRGAWTKSQRATKSRHATTGPMRPATKAERKRYVIPPSFVDAMVSTDPRAEVRATAVSPVTGKKRAVYSASYNDRQALAKWSRIAGVHRQMDKIVARVDKDSTKATSPDQQAAMALRLILQTGMRNGAENEHGTFGATSLEMQHARVEGSTVHLAFPGKGGVQQMHTITDPVLAKYVTARGKVSREPAAPLFDHSDEDTLAYMKKVAGAQYKVHDLRTWYASVYADQLVTKLLSEGLKPTTKKEKLAFQKQVAKKVAEALGNTPAVTIRNYIHPFIWKAVE